MSKSAKMAHEAAVVVDVRGQPRHDVSRRVATHAKRALDMVPWRVTLLECERSLGGQKAVDSAGVVSSSGARPVARCFPVAQRVAQCRQACPEQAQRSDSRAGKGGRAARLRHMRML